MTTHFGTNIIIVSNRLPVKVDGDGTFSVTTGGLASALASLPAHRTQNGSRSSTTSTSSFSSSSHQPDSHADSALIWVGWNGSHVEPKDQERVRQQIRNISLVMPTSNVRLEESTSEASHSDVPDVRLPGTISMKSVQHKSNKPDPISLDQSTSTPGHSEFQTPFLAPSDSAFRYEPVFLTKEHVCNYYDGFSNATLWPILHYFTTLAKYDEKWWKNYVAVNQIFCVAVLDVVSDGDLVWIHDYHLMLLPKMLREKKPELKIGFFLHVPFPSYEIFRCLPQRKQLIEGLIGADLVGFHTFNYMRHFKSAILKCLGIECCFDTVVLPQSGRHVRLGIHPIGINWNSFQEAINSNEYKESLESFAHDFGPRRLVLSVSRLDYTKGIPAMLDAIAYYLENYPHKNEITFLVIAVPSRDNVQTYVDLKEKVVKTVGEINGKFSRISCAPPIQFIYYSVNTNKLAALYSLADVCLITPLIDGMNLVAKEFIAVQPDHFGPNQLSRPGCLVLSEFTGASQELYNSLIVNPYDVVKVAETIHKALNMDPKKKLQMNEAMKKGVREHDAVYWANKFLDVLRKPVQKHCHHCALKGIPPKKSDIAARLFKSEGKKVLFLDYDGTLTTTSAASPKMNSAPSKDIFRDMFSRALSPLLSQRKAPLLPRFIKHRLALPSKNFVNLVQKLGTCQDLDIVILSERSSEHLEQHLGSVCGVLGITLVSEHGYKIKKPGDTWKVFTRCKVDWKEKLLPYLEMYMRDTPGSFIEEKRMGLVWSYYQSDQEMGQQRAADLVGQLSEFIHNLPIEIHHHPNKSVEVCAQGIGKGRVVEEILRQNEYTCAVCVGDCGTDESMFHAVNENLVKIKLGTEETLASYKWERMEQVLEWLHKQQL